MARSDREQFGRRTQQTGETIRRAEQRARAVLAAQAKGEGLVAGLGRGTSAFRRGCRLAGSAQRGLRLGELLPGRLVPVAQFHVTGVEAVDLGLEGLVLLLRPDGPLLGLVPRGGQAVDLGLGGGGA